jgi:GR25 family glycosyltransferase involved in LPS biosynthesis
MDIINNFDFYCLSFNENNKFIMNERFNKLGIQCKLYSGVNHKDKRLQYALNSYNKRQMSITYGHLDIINDYYKNSSKNYAIICEDDVMIHKNIKQILKKVLIDFNVMDLDILLLGYMLPYKINNDYNTNYSLKKPISENSLYKYHNYPEYHSGTQMYMITKKYAKYILEKYNNLYTIFDRRHIIDKLYIKEGNRALIYPMIAIEDDKQEDKYHKLCHKLHYNEWYI